MATMREKRPCVWEIRVFTGSDTRGRPTQLSRKVRGGKRDAQRLAAEFEASGGKAKPARGSVGDVLDEWVTQNLDTWEPSSARDQQSRGRSIKGIDAKWCMHDCATGQRRWRSARATT